MALFDRLSTSLPDVTARGPKPLLGTPAGPRQNGSWQRPLYLHDRIDSDASYGEPIKSTPFSPKRVSPKRARSCSIRRRICIGDSDGPGT
jgi:hypothetical protein